MGIFSRKAAPKLPREHNTQIYGDTFRTAEKLARHYGLNHDFAQYLAHASGEAYICAELNAKVCAAATLRLYKRAGAGSTPKRVRTGKRANGLTHKAMQQGRYGRKIANFTLGGAEMVEVENHPVLDLIRGPNWLYPGGELDELSWLMQWIGGNAYEHCTFEGRTPTIINPLYAQYVHIVADDEVGIRGYMYGRSGQSWHEYSPDEVIHYKLTPGLDSPLYGRGPLHAVLAQTDLLLDSLVFDIAMAKNGMRPDFWVSVPEMTSSDEIKELEKRMESKFRGVKNWGKGLFTKGETKLQPLQWHERDLMSMPKREEASKIIRRAYGHTESMADSSDSTYASAMIGYDSQFLGSTIEPALQRNALQKEKLLQWFGLDPDIYAFAYDPMVEKDEAKFGERLRLDVAAGLRTINEARVELGLEALDDENADVPLINGQPLGAQANPFAFLGAGPTRIATDETHPPGSADDTQTNPQAPALPAPKPSEAEADKPDLPEGTVPVEGVEQPNTIEETALNGAQIDKLVEVALRISAGELPKEAGRAIIIAAFPGIPPEKIAAIFVELVEGDAPPEQIADPDIAKCAKLYRPRARVRKSVLALESPQWRACEGCRQTKDDDIAADPLLREVMRRYAGSVNSLARDVLTDAQRQALDDALAGREPDLSSMRDQVAGEFRATMEDIVQAGVTNFLDNEGGLLGARDVPPEAFEIAPQRALEFLDRYTFELADDILGTTGDMAKEAVRAGLEQGLSNAEIAASMEGVPEYRAEAIARTETQRAVQSGKREGMIAVGVDKHRVITAPGVRKSHAEIAAQGAIPIDEPFVKAGETYGGETFSRDIYAPPFGVNCRCSVLPVYAEDE